MFRKLVALAACAGFAFSAQALDGPSAEQREADWTAPSGAYSLDYRAIGWDLMSKVRPKSVAKHNVVDLIAADDQHLFCSAMEAVTQYPVDVSQRLASTLAAKFAAAHPVGGVKVDAVGGSRVLVSDVRTVEDISVARVRLETLDKRRPILRTDLALFALAAGQTVRMVQVSCHVGFGSPPDRAEEPSRVLDTLRIHGKTPK